MYIKFLIYKQLFSNIYQSIILLFNSIFNSVKSVYHESDHSHYFLMTMLFVSAHEFMFNHIIEAELTFSILEIQNEFMLYLKEQICCVESEWREQEVYIIFTNFIFMLKYNKFERILMKLLSEFIQNNNSTAFKFNKIQKY